MQLRSKLEQIAAIAPQAGTPQLVPVARPATTAINVMGATMNFARNSEVYGEGERADYLYKVLSGMIRTSKILADGRRQIGSFYMPGDLFGLEVGDEHTFSAEAVTTSKVVVIKRSALIARAARDPEIARQLWAVTGSELARVQDRTLALVRSAQERVVGFLIEMADRSSAGDVIVLPMCRQDIADYLGLTMETVSRSFSTLENDGLIELPTSRQVMLRERAALTRLNA